MLSGLHQLQIQINILGPQLESTKYQCPLRASSFWDGYGHTLKMPLTHCGLAVVCMWEVGSNLPAVTDEYLVSSTNSACPSSAFLILVCAVEAGRHNGL